MCERGPRKTMTCDDDWHGHVAPASASSAFIPAAQKRKSTRHQDSDDRCQRSGRQRVVGMANCWSVGTVEENSADYRESTHPYHFHTLSTCQTQLDRPRLKPLYRSRDSDERGPWAETMISTMSRVVWQLLRTLPSPTLSARSQTASPLAQISFSASSSPMSPP